MVIIQVGFVWLGFSGTGNMVIIQVGFVWLGFSGTGNVNIIQERLLVLEHIREALIHRGFMSGLYTCCQIQQVYL